MADALVAVAGAVPRWLAAGRAVAVGRVVALQGFSTWPGDEMVAIADGGETAGAILAAAGTEPVRVAALEMLAAGETQRRVTVEIHGRAVIEAGLSCGGQAEVLLQSASTLPVALWSALGARAPVGLVTSSAGTSTLVTSTPTTTLATNTPTTTLATTRPTVGADGAESTPTGGDSGDLTPTELAAAVLAGGHSTARTVDTEGGPVLVEAWVPAPRLVVVGTGDVVAALAAQGVLLGWDARAVEDPADLDDAMGWAGATAAVVVLSHDPRVDEPALSAALTASVAYVGAMGSHRTQGRRLERLRAAGISDELLDRIHRPVGLDLGGRSASELALAICAEILASRTGRSGRPLRERQGPIRS